MFKNVVESLLKGDFICAHTQDKSFHFLSEVRNFNEVNEYLQKIGKVLKKTNSESAFYLGYSDLTDKHGRNDITEQFKVFRLNLRPIVEFIQLAMNSEKTNMPLLTGDAISLAKITSQVEVDEFMEASLKKVVLTAPRKLKANDVNTMVTNVFNFISDHGLIAQATKENKIYIVTGKIEYFYDVLAFIDDREQIQQKGEEIDQDQGTFDL